MTITPDKLASMIDHTLLKPDAGAEDILRLCSEAVNYGFQSVCVHPFRVPLAANALAGTGIKICCVAGFPLGAATTAVKTAEAAEAVNSGAREIDMVINIGLLKDGRYDLVYADVKSVVDSVSAFKHDALVKVIIETCYLTDVEKKIVCRLCEKAGAGFIKTSTGMGSAGAILSDIKLIRKTISPGMGIKASGGIRTLDQALQMIKAGATRIGTSSGVRMIQELN